MICRILFTVFLSAVLFGGCDSSQKKDINNPNECTEYVCPMHPDHTSVAPAKCPECNMDMQHIEKYNHDSTKTDGHDK